MAIKNVEFSFLGENYKAEYDRELGAYVAKVEAVEQTSWFAKYHTLSSEIKAVGSEKDPRNGLPYTVKYTDRNISELAIRVVETIPPVGSFIYPSEIPWIPYISNNQPTLSFSFSDEADGSTNSGINLDTLLVYLDGDEVKKWRYKITEDAEKEGTYNVEFPIKDILPDGFHIIRFVVKDNDDNELDKEFKFNVVTTGPIIILDTVRDRMRTNQFNLHITGITNDKWSFPTTMTVNGIDAEIDRESGIFTVTIPLENEGDNKISFVAVDELERETILAITVARDTMPPSINEVFIDPNPVDIGNTLTIRVDVTDA